MNIVVIAIIAIIVMVIIVIFATGKLSSQLTSIGASGPSANEMNKVECQRACSTAGLAKDCDQWKSLYCGKYFSEKTNVKCSDAASGLNCTAPFDKCICA